MKIILVLICTFTHVLAIPTTHVVEKESGIEIDLELIEEDEYLVYIKNINDAKKVITRKNLSLTRSLTRKQKGEVVILESSSIFVANPELLDHVILMENDKFKSDRIMLKKGETLTLKYGCLFDLDKDYSSFTIIITR